MREEAWPDAQTADELHDALSCMGYLTAQELDANPLWRGLIGGLVEALTGGAHCASARRPVGGQ